MRRSLPLVAAWMVVLPAVSSIAAPSPIQAAGAWVVTWQTSPEPQHFVLKISGSEEKPTGSVQRGRDQHPVESLTVAGDQIEFQYRASVQGRTTLLVFRGTLARGGALEGTVEVGGRTEAWSAVRASGGAAPRAVATRQGPVLVTGTWQATVQTSAGGGTPTFTLNQEGIKLSGTYRGQFGEAPITGSVQGDDIYIFFHVNYGGQDMEVVYFGKVESKASLKGTAHFGNLGMGTWTATRQ